MATGIRRGSHYAVGLYPNRTNRTDADGPLLAFRDSGDAKGYLVESMALELQEQGADASATAHEIADLAVTCVDDDDWVGSHWGLVFHDRYPGECELCHWDYVTHPGAAYYAEDDTDA